MDWDLCYLTLNLGCNMGAIAGSCLSGFCNSYFGWQSNFYIVSVIALSFGLLWCLTVCDNPQDDKKVSKDELMFITQNIIEYENVGDDVMTKFPPYLDIVKSKKVWALVSISGYLLLCSCRSTIKILRSKNPVISDSCCIL